MAKKAEGSGFRGKVGETPTVLDFKRKNERNARPPIKKPSKLVCEKKGITRIESSARVRIE